MLLFIVVYPMAYEKAQYIINGKKTEDFHGNDPALSIGLIGMGKIILAWSVMNLVQHCTKRTESTSNYNTTRV